MDEKTKHAINMFDITFRDWFEISYDISFSFPYSISTPNHETEWLRMMILFKTGWLWREND